MWPGAKEPNLNLFLVSGRQEKYCGQLVYSVAQSFITANLYACQLQCMSMDFGANGARVPIAGRLVCGTAAQGSGPRGCAEGAAPRRFCSFEQ